MARDLRGLAIAIKRFADIAEFPELAEFVVRYLRGLAIAIKKFAEFAEFPICRMLEAAKLCC